MAITWTEHFSIKIPEIDEQHKELIRKINSQLEACSQRRSSDYICEVLRSLEEYAVDHFRTEETFMKTHGYPDYSDHKAQHDDFIKKFSTLKNQFVVDITNVSAVVQLNHLVVDWLVKHILNADKKLGEFYNQKG